MSCTLLQFGLIHHIVSPETDFLKWFLKGHCLDNTHMNFTSFLSEFTLWMQSDPYPSIQQLKPKHPNDRMKYNNEILGQFLRYKFLKKKKNQMPLEALFKEETPAFPNRESLKSVCIFSVYFDHYFRKHQVTVTTTLNHSPLSISPHPTSSREWKIKMFIGKHTYLQETYFVLCAIGMWGLYSLYILVFSCMYVCICLLDFLCFHAFIYIVFIMSEVHFLIFFFSLLFFNIQSPLPRGNIH